MFSVRTCRYWLLTTDYWLRRKAASAAMAEYGTRTANCRRALERKWQEVKLEKLQVSAKGVTRWTGRAGTVMAAPRPLRVNFIEHVSSDNNTLRPANWQTLQASEMISRCGLVICFLIPHRFYWTELLQIILTFHNLMARDLRNQSFHYLIMMGYY